jgi:ABC-type nitrate/sulfonate/bicarbonate transport system permease component
MSGHLTVIVVVTALFAAVICYALTRRYGWKAALSLPLLALVATVAMLWQEGHLESAGGMTLVTFVIAFAGPTLLGALIGIAVARLRPR